MLTAVCVFETLDHNHSPPPHFPPAGPATHRSGCVLCHIPLRRSWTGCLAVLMHTLDTDAENEPIT